MESKTIEIFLNKIVSLAKIYEERKTLSGENFNVFNILNLSTNEVRTHSAFLAELLNPKGSHNQKELFLELFVKQLGIVNFSCPGARIEVEKYIGPISESKSEGGYIDIIITDTFNNSIIIENKIYAGDQEKQLLRYSNFGKNNRNSFYLYYLTIEGKDATDFSKLGLKKEDFTNISYTSNILKWLESCHKESVHLPILRETILQYINLIKILTNQTIYKDMEKEIIEILKSNPDFIDIMPNLNSIAENMKTNLIKEILNSLNSGFKQTPINIKDIDFKIEAVSDGDGFAYCFFGYKGVDVVPLSTYINEFFEKKRLDFEKRYNYKLSGWPIFWKNFNENPTQLEKMNYTELLSISQPEILQKLKEEMEEARKLFLEIMEK